MFAKTKTCARYAFSIMFYSEHHIEQPCGKPNETTIPRQPGFPGFPTLRVRITTTIYNDNYNNDNDNDK